MQFLCKYYVKRHSHIWSIRWRVQDVLNQGDANLLIQPNPFELVV